MNGYELVQAIRRHEQHTQQPRCTVLGFTANAQPEEIKRCKQAGMDDCLFKPLSLAALSQWVKGIQPTVAAPAFSLQGLHSLTGGSPMLNRRLLTELLNSNRLDRQGLQALPGTGDPQAFLDMAHRIKGAARIVQATRLIDSCEALEAACQARLPPENVSECCGAVERALLELEQALLQQIEQNDPSTMNEP
jgi:two-component system sensor histidine kinase EvgS